MLVVETAPLLEIPGRGVEPHDGMAPVAQTKHVCRFIRSWVTDCRELSAACSTTMLALSLLRLQKKTNDAYLFILERAMAEKGPLRHRACIGALRRWRDCGRGRPQHDRSRADGVLGVRNEVSN